MATVPFKIWKEGVVEAMQKMKSLLNTISSEVNAILTTEHFLICSSNTG